MRTVLLGRTTGPRDRPEIKEIMYDSVEYHIDAVSAL